MPTASPRPLLPVPLLLAAALPALWGCAVDRGGTALVREDLDWLRAGATTEQEVRDRLGEPFDLREAADGARYLRYHAYAIGPYGLPNDSDVAVFFVRDGAVQEAAEGDFF